MLPCVCKQRLFALNSAGHERVALYTSRRMFNKHSENSTHHLGSASVNKAELELFQQSRRRWSPALLRNEDNNETLFIVEPSFCLMSEKLLIARVNGSPGDSPNGEGRKHS